MGFLKVLGKSTLKGLKTMGQVAAAGAITAVLAEPEVIASVASVAGLGAPVAVLGITLGLRTVLDLFKHRDKITE